MKARNTDSNRFIAWRHVWHDSADYDQNGFAHLRHPQPHRQRLLNLIHLSHLPYHPLLCRKSVSIGASARRDSPRRYCSVSGTTLNPYNAPGAFFVRHPQTTIPPIRINSALTSSWRYQALTRFKAETHQPLRASALVLYSADHKVTTSFVSQLITISFVDSHQVAMPNSRP